MGLMPVSYITLISQWAVIGPGAHKPMGDSVSIVLQSIPKPISLLD